MTVDWDVTAEAAIRIGGRELARKRDMAREYLARTAKDGLDTATVVAVIAEHAKLNNYEQAHGSATHDAQVTAMADDAVRLMIGVCAALHTIGGWTYTEWVDDALRDGYPIPGALVGRMMHPAKYGPTDAATADRLVETLGLDERMFLVCSTAAMLGALGFTRAAIAALGDPLETVANAAPGDVTPDLVDAAMRQVDSLISEIAKPETD